MQFIFIEMIISKFRLVDGELVPDNDGNIIAIKENNIVIFFDNDGNIININNYRLLVKDRVILNKIKLLEELLGKEIDVNRVIILKDNKLRYIELSKIFGKYLEDFVYLILSKHYKTERHLKIFETLSRFTGNRYYIYPDIIVENKVAVEVKSKKVIYEQLLSYSKKYKYGILVYPWTGECKVPSGWSCIFNVLKDPQRLIERINLYLSK